MAIQAFKYERYIKIHMFIFPKSLKTAKSKQRDSTEHEKLADSHQIKSIIEIYLSDSTLEHRCSWVGPARARSGHCLLWAGLGCVIRARLIIGTGLD